MVERRAWPTAPTTTHISPATPASGPRRGRSRGSASTPTPASVWTAGTTPIDLDATWPVALVQRIVTAFSAPDAHVTLLPWPTPTDTPRRPDTISGDTAHTTAANSSGVNSDTTPGTARDVANDVELGAAATAVEQLGRHVHIGRVPVPSTDTAAASAPFWADLIDSRDVAPANVPTLPAPRQSDHPAADAYAPEHPVSAADLVIASIAPHHLADGRSGRTIDAVALAAARLLRVGGTLVVLTHCDWTSGELADPTGAIVAAGQNADLLYLQHIVAVHTPLRDGRFDTDNRTDEADRTLDTAITDAGSDTSDAFAAHEETCGRRRGMPHRRVHSDVLLFSQPHARPDAPSLTSDELGRRGDHL